MYEKYNTFIQNITIDLIIAVQWYTIKNVNDLKLYLYQIVSVMSIKILKLIVAKNKK